MYAIYKYTTNFQLGNDVGADPEIGNPCHHHEVSGESQRYFCEMSDSLSADEDVILVIATITNSQSGH